MDWRVGGVREFDSCTRMLSTIFFFHFLSFLSVLVSMLDINELDYFLVIRRSSLL